MPAIARGPLDDDELWEYVYTLFGIRIPRQRVCPGHNAPFEAFADAYFARSPVAVWKASRGFGGKTMLLSTLCATELAGLGAELSLLGGSGQQSFRIHEATETLWEFERAPKHLVEKQVTGKTALSNGGRMTALTASQASVRGPHPQRLRLDEIDEMELAILESAQGQPMYRHGIEPHTVMSSTHQYPDGTMSEMLTRAEEKDWPVFHWCYKESSNPIDGWLRPEDIERKRREVSNRMFEVEYDLQDPLPQGNAIDTGAVDAMFDPALGVYDGKPGERVIIEEYSDSGEYAHGADWAKEKDWTVICTLRSDPQVALDYAHVAASEDDPVKVVLVGFERFQRLPWPIAVGKYDKRMEQYGAISRRSFTKASACHDATGIGNVISDLITYPSENVLMQGKNRDDLLSEYVAAIERGEIRAPRIEWMYKEHFYATYDDLYGRGHCPDSIVAGAMAFRAYKRGAKGLVLAAPNLKVQRSGGVSPWLDR